MPERERPRRIEPLPQREFTERQAQAVSFAFVCLEDTLQRLSIQNPTPLMQPSDVRFVTREEYSQHYKAPLEALQGLDGNWNGIHANVFREAKNDDVSLTLEGVILHELIHGEVQKRRDSQFLRKTGYMVYSYGNQFFFGLNEAATEHTANFGLTNNAQTRGADPALFSRLRENYYTAYQEYFRILDNMISNIVYSKSIQTVSVWENLMKGLIVPNLGFLANVYTEYGDSGIVCLALLGTPLQSDGKLSDSERKARKEERTQVIENFFRFNNGRYGYLGFSEDLDAVLLSHTNIQERIGLMNLISVAKKGSKLAEKGIRSPYSHLEELGASASAIGILLGGTDICVRSPIIGSLSGGFIIGGVAINRLGARRNDIAMITYENNNNLQNS